MYEKPLTVVFDCNLFIQMALNPSGAAFRCLDLVKKGQAELYVSKTVLAEVASVLSRPRIQMRVPALTVEKIAAFVEDIAAVALELVNIPEEFKYARDPDDEAYINLALAVPAAYLVSLDNDLLDLQSDKTEESRTFRRRFPMLKIVPPQTFIQQIEARANI